MLDEAPRSAEPPQSGSGPASVPVKRSARAPFAPDFDHLVYLRIVEACDLACAHCFIPANAKRMRMDAITRTPDLVRTFAEPGSRILLQWHGGEPTLVGPKFMAEAIGAIEAGGSEYRWTHGIQTNLMSYSPEWADLFRAKFSGQIGVSWDPGIRLMRKDDYSSNAEFESRFWPALDQAVADGLDPCLTVTGTKVFFDSVPNPIEFLDMLESRGVTRAHIERITPTGTARRNWERLGVSNGMWSRSMTRFLRAYSRWLDVDPTRKLRLSPFDGLVASASALADGAATRGSGCLSGACDTRFHTVDQNGYKRGCTALTSESDNARADPIAKLSVEDPSKAREERQIFNCHSCRFRAICSSGCLALDFDDGSGECSGGKALLQASLDEAVRRGGKGVAA